MRKRVAITIVLSIMILAFILNSGQTVKYMAENDGEIEWQSHEGGKLQIQKNERYGII